MRPHPIASVSLAFVLTAAPTPGLAAQTGWVPLEPAAGQGVRSLAVVAGSPSHLLAGAESGVFRTEDGARWELLNGGGLPLGATGRLLVAPDPGSPVYAFVDRFSLRALEDLIFRSEDAGGSWTRIKEEATGGVLAVAPGDPETLYLVSPADAETGRRGVETSRDGGDTWTPVAPIPVPDDAAFAGVSGVAVAYSDPDTVFVLLDIVGDKGFPNDILLARSDDGGARWTLIDGPDRVSAGARQVVLDPLDPTTIYVVLGTGIYRSADGGTTWEPRNDGLPSSTTGGGPERQTRIPVEALAIDPAAPATLYAAFAADPLAGIVSGVFRSDDAGATWTRAAQGLAPALAIHDLAVGAPPAPGVSGSGPPGACSGPTTVALTGATRLRTCRPRSPRSRSIRPRPAPSSRAPPTSACS